ncbi:MAG: MotA/TolQ/ExbB proton channel family protein [Bacillota bacterium]|nr:MotA/TolQ/ExbB proton channel family protein [Bacillota bacterium]
MGLLHGLKEAMHQLSAILLVPTIAVLLFFICFTVVELGSLLVEWLVSRRTALTDVSELVKKIKMSKDAAELERLLVESRMLRRQKEALSALLAQVELPHAAWEALARRMLTREELFYTKIVTKTELVARLGPMLGLMATLIPLGPGLIALSQGDTKKLAESLLTAFDATVLGLASAAIAYFISRVRRRWYEDYMSILETVTEALLEVSKNYGIAAEKEGAADFGGGSKSPRGSN